MSKKRIKVSELTPAASLEGFCTLGYKQVDGKSTSVKLDLSYVQKAYENTVDATGKANKATDAANKAASDANTKMSEITQEASQTMTDLRQLEATVSDQEAIRETFYTQVQAKEQARQNDEIKRQEAAKAQAEAEALRQQEEAKRNATFDAKVQEATNAANDASEQARFAQAEGEKVAQYDNRITLLETGKANGLLVDGGLLYLTSDDEVISDGVEVATGGGGGSGGGITMKVKSLTASLLSSIAGQELRIGYNFTSVYTDDNTPTGTGTAMYYVNSQKVASATVEQGDNYFEASKYLTVGTNKIKVTVNDATGASRSLSYIVDVISLSITDSYDDTLVNTGVITYRYTPIGAVEKTIHFILDGVEIGTEVTTISNRQMSYIIPAQGHGAHKLEVYMTTLVNDTEVRSNTLTHDLICVEAGNNTVIVASPFNQITAKQYDMLTIPFIIYNPTVSSSPVTLSVNDTVVSEQTVDRTPQTWNYRLNHAGSVALKIASGAVSKTFNLTVSEAETIVEAETADLELYLTSQNRSNNDNKRAEWKSGDIEASLTDFNWRTNGWITEGGSTALRVSGNARVVIPFKIFDTDFRASGKTIEFEFATRDVINYSAVVIDCLAGIGLQVTAQEALFKSEQTSVDTRFKEEERVRVAFVVEKKTANRLIYIFINGILSGVAQYPEEDNFQQAVPSDIVIGSNDCTVDIYNIRVYNNNLTQYQLLDNFIADVDDYDRKMAIYGRNQVYNAYGDISYDATLDLVPGLIIVGELPQYKGDKKTVTLTYTDKQHPERSFTANNVQLDVQGTSSQYYPRKNYKFKLKSGLTMSESGETKEAYPLRPDGIPAKVFCTKADFAESSGTHNTGMAVIADKLLKDLNILVPPQLTNNKVRTTIDGFPICIFHRPTADGAIGFVGKYNFNYDKGAEETFGFAEGDECWEFRNNTSDRMLFKSADFTGTDWTNDFEARYPDDDAINAEYEAGTRKPVNLMALMEWVVSTGNDTAKFKAEVADHFDLNNLLSYYLFTELFAMVDQRAKNMFLTRYAADGKWRFILYDNDTCLGINNEGLISFGYNVEYHDKIGTLNVWNGESSVLWKNVETCFPAEIETMYKNIRSNGYLSYDYVMSVLNGEQSDKWCEAIYNADGKFKYIDPLVEDGNGSYLYAAQGSREEHRKWWAYNRFLYMDSKYNAGDFLTDFATMRLYTPQDFAGVTPNADFTLIPYADQYVRVKYGSYVLGQRGNKDVPVHITAPDIQFNDTETIVYGASRIKSLGDLSGKYAGTVDVSKCTRLTELLIGSGVEGYHNDNLTVLSVGANTMLRRLDIRNCPNLTQAVDLSGCENIDEVWAEGTNITSVILPGAGILSTLHLPGSVTNLTVKNQPNLTDAGLYVAGINSLTTIVLENVAFNVFSLLERCLSLDVPVLSRIRCIGISGSAATADILYRIAEIGGIDENGYNIDRAVLTGSFHVGTIREDKLEELGEIYPELAITYDTLTYPPVVTFIFASSQGKVMSAGKFTSNRRVTKVNEFTFKVTAEVGEEITYTYSCNNHVEISGTVTCSGDETKEYTVEYIPLRRIRILKKNTTLFISGAIVTIEDVNYTTNATGYIQLRNKKAVVGTVAAGDYNDSSFAFEAITDDTDNTVYLDPCAVVTFTVRDDKNKLLSGATVTVGGKQATTNSNGVCTIALKQESYVYTVKYENYFAKGDVVVSLTNISVSVTVSLDITTMKPEENGNIQMMLAGTAGELNITSSSTDYIIDWGDGETTVAAGTGAQKYKHTYSDDSYHQVEISGCENITSANGVAKSLIAYWSIGDSKVVNLKFHNFELLMYVGLVFCNDTTRTSFASAFCYCSKLKTVPANLFENCTKAKYFGGESYTEGCFVFCGDFLIPEGLFDNCTEVLDFGCCFYGTNISNIPKGLFDNCPNAVNFNSCFEACLIDYIPEGLFDNCPNAIKFNGCFGNNNLTSIPNGLFHNCIKAETFGKGINNNAGCFANNQITTIPPDLFHNCPEAIDFSSCFARNKITSIPAGLFNNCVKAKKFGKGSNSSKGCFGDNPIVSIPVGLFDNCVAVTDFDSCFSGCSQLTVIPVGLFDNCPAVTNFGNCFSGCSKVENLPSLWILYYGKNIFRQYCFSGCSFASNWSEVPVSWGGEGPEWYPPFDSAITVKIIKDATWWLNQSVVINNTSFTQLADGSYSARLSGVRVNQELEVSINGSPQGTIVLEENKTSYMLLVGDNSKLYSTYLDYTIGNLNEDSIISNDGWAYDSEVGGLRSKKITSNGSTIFEVKTSAGQLTVTYGQSSENNYDYCTLYTGGSTKLIDLKGATYQGDNLTIDVEVTENLKFTYHKDGSGDSGKDAFWIKKIIGGFTLPNLPSDFVPATPVAVSGAVLADMRAVNYRLARVETALGFND